MTTQSTLALFGLLFSLVSVVLSGCFVKRYRSDEEFRAWFAPVDAGMSKVSEGDNRRLIEIQRALVALIRELDPNNRYTFGYQLEPTSARSG